MLINKPAAVIIRPLLSTVVSLIIIVSSALFSGCHCVQYAGMVARKEDRWSITETEDGQVWATEIRDVTNATYHLQFITMEPNSLFLPVLLHADMVLFVRTGSGRLSWTDENDMRTVDLRRGDLYRLQPGTIFHIQSNLETEREKLRIHAIFVNPDENFYVPSIGAYSSIGDLVRGFDRKVLQEAFKVSEEVVEEIIGATRPPAIIHAIAPAKKATFLEKEARLLKTYLTSGESSINSKKRMKPYNVYDADRDFENCNGWSLTVTKKNLHSLKHSNIGVFMVNLTKGAMMAPHWNPRATEVAIVLQGEGMVRVVCSSSTNESECRNTRFRVGEGDVFVVPQFRPMAQMSFNNDSLVFMGFSTMTKRNYPQFLVGKNSILQALGTDVLAASFNVPNTTVYQLLAPQTESVILECTSCAEEEERIMEEEIEEERKRQEEEEEREREEEEERERQEEEARKREEEEAARRREEEEARKRQEEEERQREEEEARKRQEEEERQREEEAARRQEEEARQRQEEEQRQREEEEEEARRQEKERQRREQEEEEERQRREQEEEEVMRRREEEEREQRRQEEEERREEERREQEEAAARRREEEARRRQEAAAREEEEAQRQEEEMRRRQGGQWRGRPHPEVEWDMEGMKALNYVLK